MEDMYRKLKDGTFEHIGLNSVPDISDGIWLVQNRKHSKGYTSLLWKVGDTGRATDVLTHGKIHSLHDELCTYIQELTKKDSSVHKDAKELLGGFFREDFHFTGLSPSDLISLLLRKISFILEDREQLYINKKNPDPSYTTLWELLTEARNESDNQGLTRISETLNLLLELINVRGNSK